ncbi:MAG: immunoglobulin domain-containing protein, partial [Limisphaerales bacterium]
TVNLVGSGHVVGATNSSLTIVGSTVADAGSYQVTVTDLYGSATSAAATLTVVLPPNISAISNQKMFPFGAARTIAFSVNDPQNSATTVTVQSLNTSLLANTNLVLGGSGSNRTLTITPGVTSGTATVRVTAQNSYGAATQMTFTVTFASFSLVPAGLPDLQFGIVKWGDYDNDGRLDLFLSGWDTNFMPHTYLFHNDGNGAFSSVAAAFTDIVYSSAEWVDFDNDGYLDIVLAGYNPVTGLNPVRVFRNLRNGQFALAATVCDAQSGAVACGDYDNDGKPDIAVTGSDPRAFVFRNMGNWSFVQKQQLVGGSSGSVSWVDVNGDGYLDLFVAGVVSNYVYEAHLYRNTGNGNFTEIRPLPMPGAERLVAAWGDYDGDGLPDLLYSGFSTNTSQYFSALYRNNNGTLQDSGAKLPQLLDSLGAWGDFDNDGKLDFFLAGNESDRFAGLFRNRGSNSFVNIGGALVPCDAGQAAFADYDNDGALDLIYCGETPEQATTAQTRLLHNDGALPNTPPTAPSGLSAVTSSATVVLSWNAATDAEQTAALNYNVRIGTTPGAADVLSPMSDLGSGWRRVAQTGNAGYRLSKTLMNLGTGTYYWSVQAIDNAFAGSQFSAEQSFQINATPIIVTPPQSKMVLLNNSWSMSVTVMGATPLSYQWYRNGAKIFDDGLVSGTTSSNLTCSISLQSQAGNYSVVASNSFGTATSTAATLTIMTPLSISGPPNALAAVGSNAVFAAVIGGSQPSTNKWLFNGSVVVTNKHYSIFEIATNTGILSVLTLSNVQPSDVGGYSLMASNVLQSATSSVASLTVGFPPSITTQPQSQTVVTNGSVSFTVASDGDAPIIYQWYHNGTIVVDDAQTSGSQLATLSISNLSINNQGSYTVVCSNAFGNAGSTAALLTVLQAPSISDPQTLAVGVGSNATFSVLISGAVPETNQWYFNGTPLSNSSHITISEQPVAAGTNQSTLTIASIQDSDAGSYWVVASNMVGATTSSVGTLTIGYAPTITNQPTSQTVTNGIPFTLTVGATGSDPLSYQWYLGISSLGDGTRYTGTRTSSLTDTNPTSSDAGSYSVVVTNAFGSVTSSNAVVTVLIRPTVTAQPLGRSVPLGLATLFAASVTATTPLSYQWQLNGADIADATNSTYKIASVSTNDLGAYTLIVSNMAGVAVSSNALLTVGPVVGFGNNSYNQCIPPPGLSNVVAVTGVYCGFALTANGSLVKWGSSTSSPAIPIDFTNIVAFAANLNPPAFQGDRGLALRADGTVSGYAGTVPTTWTNITSVA